MTRDEDALRRAESLPDWLKNAPGLRSITDADACHEAMNVIDRILALESEVAHLERERDEARAKLAALEAAMACVTDALRVAWETCRAAQEEGRG